MNLLQKISCAAVTLLWCSGLVRGTVLSPDYQFELPLGHNYAIDLETDGTKLFLITVDTYYAAPFDLGGSMVFEKAPVNLADLGIRLTPDSPTVFNPEDPNEMFMSGGLGFSTYLYSFRFLPPAQTNALIAGMAQKPAGLAVAEDGAIFLSSRTAGQGIFKLPNADNGTPELIFGTSGPGALNTPQALSLGPNGLLYVLDTGDERIVAFNNEGEYQSAFSLAGEAMESALAIDDQGRLYTMNSLGGGDIYDIYTGAHVGTLENTNDVEIGPGKASLLYTGGYLFATTGHGANVYVYAVPEPGAPALLLLAMTGLTGLTYRCRRRSALKSSLGNC